MFIAPLDPISLDFVVLNLKWLMHADTNCKKVVYKINFEQFFSGDSPHLPERIFVAPFLKFKILVAFNMCSKSQESAHVTE